MEEDLWKKELAGVLMMCGKLIDLTMVGRRLSTRLSVIHKRLGINEEGYTLSLIPPDYSTRKSQTL